MAVVQLVDEPLARLDGETSSGDAARLRGWARLVHIIRHPTEEEEDLLLPQAKKERRNVKLQKVFF